MDPNLIGNSLAKALKFCLGPGCVINTIRDGSSLPVIGSSLKGVIITSDFFLPLLGKKATVGRRLGKEKDTASESGNSDRKDMWRSKRRDRVLAAFF